MAIPNEEFQNIIKKLSDKNFDKLKEYAQKLLNEDVNSFENGVEYVFESYNETLKGLQDR